MVGAQRKGNGFVASLTAGAFGWGPLFRGMGQLLPLPASRGLLAPGPGVGVTCADSGWSMETRLDSQGLFPEAQY